jgi:hypothetical protein
MFKNGGDLGHNVEVGERKIRGKIDDEEMDQVIYGGKKVSRR